MDSKVSVAVGQVWSDTDGRRRARLLEVKSVSPDGREVRCLIRANGSAAKETVLATGRFVKRFRLVSASNVEVSAPMVAQGM